MVQLRLVFVEASYLSSLNCTTIIADWAVGNYELQVFDQKKEKIGIARNGLRKILDKYEADFVHSLHSCAEIPKSKYPNKNNDQ